METQNEARSRINELQTNDKQEIIKGIETFTKLGHTRTLIKEGCGRCFSTNELLEYPQSKDM